MKEIADMLKMPASNKPVDPLLAFTIIVTMVSLVVFAVIPLVKVLIQSFISYEGTVSFDAYIRAFTSEENFKALSHSLTLGAASGILSTAIGFLFAYSAAYVQMRWKRLFNLIAMLPIVSPPLPSRYRLYCCSAAGD